MATYVVQSIRIPRDHHRLHGKGVRGARTIAREYAKGDAARIGKVDTTAGFYRFRLRAPSLMRPGSYRTYTSPSGVEVVSAVPKARRNPRATVCACETVKVPRRNPYQYDGEHGMGPNERYTARMERGRDPTALPLKVWYEQKRRGTETFRPVGKFMRFYYNANTGHASGPSAGYSRAWHDQLDGVATKAYRELYPDGHPNAQR